MKLFLLKPQENLPEDNAWEPWFDKIFGFVIVANNEIEARQLAHKYGGSETGTLSYGIYRTGGNPWLDPIQSSCIELIANNYKEADIILSDLRQA
jgi:hypothetical protein